MPDGMQPRMASSGATALRTGAEFLQSLDDGREIFIDGERVANVVEHPVGDTHKRTRP